MCARMALLVRRFGWMALLLLVSCAVEGEQEDQAVSDITLGPATYNGTGRCTVSGTTMHCCPGGMAMIGAHLDKDVFKCAGVTTLVGARFVDSSTLRNGMHCCPQGSVMVGLHVDQNKLLCQAVSPTPLRSGEFVDFTSRDSFVMHVCGRADAVMAGIHVDGDWFTCDT